MSRSPERSEGDEAIPVGRATMRLALRLRFARNDMRENAPNNSTDAPSPPLRTGLKTRPYGFISPHYLKITLNPPLVKGE